MGFELNMGHVFFLSAALMGIILVEFAHTLFAPQHDKRKQINRRMKSVNDKKVSQKDILVQLRRERGLDEDGKFVLSFAFINRLITQSGITLGLKKVAIYYATYVIGALAITLYATGSPIITVASLPIFLIAVPFAALRHLRNKKMNTFGAQLPESIDLITRGLKAGHPVPVAIAMVAREMPDPIGSEFGMVTDEVTFGSDLVTALNNLYERVGHPDLPLLISSVSIQATTGGNLREILENLSGVVRERQKMKRKIKAISAEGRMSAIFLSAIPVILFFVLLALMPNYYGGIWDKPETFYAFGGLAFWLVTGNALIMKLVSFKF